MGDDTDVSVLAALLREAGELVSRLEALLHTAPPAAPAAPVPAAPASVEVERSTPRAISIRARLTRRESHVMELLLLGLTNRQIARTMLIAEPTVKNHLHSIFGKLGVADRTQAVTKVLLN